ncbi:hypothetical protein QW131_19020 [Roseibium salinum]|nr:hypothetical protein [Roseibium salinum]
MSTDDEKKHTDFWSRRKAAVRKAEEAERELKQEAQTAERRAELEQKSDAEILEELDLPDPDTLVKGGTIFFPGFFQRLSRNVCAAAPCERSGAQIRFWPMSTASTTMTTISPMRRRSARS